MIDISQRDHFVTVDSHLCLHLNNISKLLEGLFYRLSTLSDNCPPPGTNGEVLFQGTVVKKHIQLPVAGHLQGHLDGTQELGMVIRCFDRGIDAGPNPIELGNLGSLIFIPVLYAFVQYYEDNKPNPVTPIWAFARVIRNAISHDGKIDIRNSSAPPVLWRGLTYQYSNNGHKPFEADFSVADMFVLLLDMANEIGDLPNFPPGSIIEPERSQF